MVTIWLRRTLAPSTSALTGLAIALFLLNSVVAMRRALVRSDARVAAFVATATVLLIALLATVRAHERAAREERLQRRRGLFKAAAWAQSAVLTAIFAHRVAAVLAQQAPAMACVVWAMAGSTMAGGFYCLFLHGWDDDTDDVVVEGGHDARQA